MNQNQTIVASSPGKVLICGGYVVLHGANALVISTSSRFHTEIVSLPGDSLIKEGSIFVSVYSPQFGCKYQYILTNHADSGISFEVTDTLENPYVFYSLLYAFSYLSCSYPSIWNHKHLYITIYADNDFYSHSTILRSNGIKPTREALKSLKPFSNIYYGDQRIAKTGLGSSASLVTSLVAAVLSWGGQWVSPDTNSDLRTHEHLNTIHNIAQIAHCQAQGKIGSGFDVSAAIYGSHIYKRFSKSCVEDLIGKLSDSNNQIISLSPTILESVLAIAHLNWDKFVKPLSLPKGFILALCETGKDMNTPLSVRKVLDWAQSNQEKSQSLFGSIEKNNESFIQILQNIHHLSNDQPDLYQKRRNDYAKLTSNQLKSLENDDSVLLPLLKSMIIVYESIREVLKILTNETETPIEPSIITSILDEMMDIPGVIVSGAPGAGGYDALFCFLLDEECYPKLEEFWLSYKDLPLSPLLTREDHIGIKVEVKNSINQKLLDN